MRQSGKEYTKGRREKTDKCKITDADGNEITECVFCGMRIDAHDFIEVGEGMIGNYEVQILECKKCRTPSFGWIRKES